MRKVNERDKAYQNIIKVTKRIAITILCCVPVMIVFGYLMRNIIPSNVTQIICFIVIMGTAVLIEEIVARKKEKQKKEDELINPKKDVFK